jgi:hypothetical protein
MGMCENLAVTITNKEFWDKDEIYTNFFICPNCKDDNLIQGFNFCPNCGIKLEWKVDNDELEEMYDEGWRGWQLNRPYKMTPEPEKFHYQFVPFR